MNLDSIADADALIVRSVTRIDGELLEGSKVQFVGSATAGTDHVDTAYLDSKGIRFAFAPGANAESVVEYVLAAIFELAVHAKINLYEEKIGIVGAGAIGGELSRRLTSLGISYLVCDPPLQKLFEERGSMSEFVDLHTLISDCDIISLHVPLKEFGPDRTVKLINASRLSQIRRGAWIINTSRGGVLDERALIQVLGDGSIGKAIVDVWEHEPDPDPELSALASIATPHIAGYSLDAKRRSTDIILNQFLDYFSLTARDADGDAEEGSISLAVPPGDPAKSPIEYAHDLIRQMYDIREDDVRFRANVSGSGQERRDAFRRLRNEYPIRFSFRRYRLDDARLDSGQALSLQNGLSIDVTRSRQVSNP